MIRARGRKGRKQRIVTDAFGFLMLALIHAANIEDREGAVDVLKAIHRPFPLMRHVFADGDHAEDKLRAALKGNREWTPEIIKRSDTAKRFKVLPHRWLVERTFVYLNCCRRLDKDRNRSIKSSTAWANIASIRILTRRIALLLATERVNESGSEALQTARS